MTRANGTCVCTAAAQRDMWDLQQGSTNMIRPIDKRGKKLSAKPVFAHDFFPPGYGQNYWGKALTRERI